MNLMEQMKCEGHRDGKLEILKQLMQRIDSGSSVLDLKEWAKETAAPLQAEIDEIEQKKKEDAERIRYVYRHGQKDWYNTKTCVFKGTMPECQAFIKDKTSYHSIEDQAPWDGKIHSKNENEQE